MNGKISNEVKLPSSLIMEKKYINFGNTPKHDCGIKPCFEYKNEYFFIGNLSDEINFIFICIFNDIAFYHYMNQPISMLSRKPIINLLQNQRGYYTHKWLPYCFVYNYIPTDE